VAWDGLERLGDVFAKLIGLPLLVANWPYTTVLVDVATGQGMQNLLRAALVLIFFGGAVLGAIGAGGFEIRGAGFREIASRTMGGMLMGVGAAMIPGGNDALVLIGFPIFPLSMFEEGKMIAQLTTQPRFAKFMLSSQDLEP
jgi:hypothetical protein